MPGRRAGGTVPGVPADDDLLLAGGPPPSAPPLSDAELERQALAADPDAPVPADAVALSAAGTLVDGALLPDWYMPAPTTRSRPRGSWQRKVAYVLIGAFLAIDAAGLCSTYGIFTL